MSHFNIILKKIKSEYFNEDEDHFFSKLNTINNLITKDQFKSVFSGEKKPDLIFVDAVLNMVDEDLKSEVIENFALSVFENNYRKQEKNSSRFLHQKNELELNEAQISELVKSKVHYYLFMILALKNEKIKKINLNSEFKGVSIEQPLNDLISKKILVENKGSVYIASAKLIFPQAHNETLKKYYLLFDEWDKEFSKAFGLENIIRKTLIQKISTQHIPLIQKQIELAIQMTKASAEAADYHSTSTSVVNLNIQFSYKK